MLFNLSLLLLSILFFNKNNMFLFSLIMLLMVLFKLSPQFIPSMCKKFLVLDELSKIMILLTLLMGLLVYISVNMKYLVKNMLFSMMLLSVNFILILSFLSNDILFFFVWFELSIMPMLILMLGWGSQPERLLAGAFMFLYTLFGSMPLLMKILVLKNLNKKDNFFLINFLFFNKEYSNWLNFFSTSSVFMLFWVLSFLIKLPIYGFHLWLPKAHVEASLVGSMLLAGILLKLGSYGLLRIIKILNMKFSYTLDFFFVWCLFGLVFSSIICFRQHDLKSIMAYSSIAHMGLTFLSLYYCKIMSLMGILIMLVSHGVVSSGLFLNITTFYNLSNSRSMLIKKGLMYMLPLSILFLFCLCSSKMSFPPTLSFFSEILMMSSMNYFWSYSLILMLLTIFLVGLFKMYMYSVISHGKKNFFSLTLSIKFMENFSLFFHSLLSIMLIVSFKFFF